MAFGHKRRGGCKGGGGGNEATTQRAEANTGAEIVTYQVGEMKDHGFVLK